jgi:hypothetical protein
MQKILTGFIILCVNLGYTSQVCADLRSDILDCSAIQKNAERLDCFDTVTKYHKTRSSIGQPVVSPNKTAPIAAPEKAIVALPARQAQPQNVSADDSFGQTSQDKLQSIQSRIVGDFSGWKKGMKITLENGQVWKVTSNAAGYRKLTNPEVTISRGVFNSFNAKVEGLNAKVKVKRIK